MTDEKRAAIVAAAWEVFGEKGFDRTAMSDISDRVRGSKATIYRYFKSKEELFAAALEQAVRAWAEQAFERLSEGGDLRDRLLDFARSYLKMRLAPEMIGIDRALISAADHSDVGVALWSSLVRPQWGRLAAIMEHEMGAGRLRKGDPYMAAMHFRGLVESDVLERRLHGDRSIGPGEAEESAASGVEAFLRAYAPGAVDAFLSAYTPDPR